MHRITEHKVILTLDFEELVALVKKNYAVQDVELNNIYLNESKRSVTIILIEQRKDNIDLQPPEILGLPVEKVEDETIF